jgi:uncharacterized protein
MEHPVTSTSSLVSLDSSQDSEPPSVAFSTSSARLHERSHGLALATALLAGVLGCLALLGNTHAPVRAAAEPYAANDLDTFRAGCEQGNAAACNNLGVTYEHGAFGAPNPRAAFRAFDRACDGGNADGCSNLGALYERGEGASVDLKQSLQLYERACYAGSALGCSNLGALHARGRGVQRDRGEARRLFMVACDNGSAAGCSNLMALNAR